MFIHLFSKIVKYLGVRNNQSLDGLHIVTSQWGNLHRLTCSAYSRWQIMDNGWTVFERKASDKSD